MTPNRRPLKSRETWWARALAQALARRKVTPNSISSAGMVFATIGALCFFRAGLSPDVAPIQFALQGGLRVLMLAPQAYAPIFLTLAAAGVQLRLMCNLLDGLVAVEGGLKSRGGDLFNEAPDRYEDVVLLASAGWAAGVPTLGWIAATGAVLTAYVRAFGASLGQGQDFCGPLAKQQRMFFLTLGALGGAIYRPVLLWALWLIALGAMVTAVRRILRLYAKLP